MMKRYAGFILVLLSALVAHGSNQAPDVIHFEGLVEHLYVYPLEQMYEGSTDRPDFRLFPTAGSSTGNVRNYVATWSVQTNKLFLIGVDSWINGRKVRLSDLDPSADGKTSLLASWFTGDLWIPTGKCIRQAGQFSIYDRYVVLTIKKGKVVARHTKGRQKMTFGEDAKNANNEIQPTE